MKNMDLTKGTVFKTLCVFALPMILGNMLQQGYNIVDTWVVGKFIGSDALAAVGSAFAAGVKIDAFAYTTVQEYANSFSTFIAQNKGAGKNERIS